MYRNMGSGSGKDATDDSPLAEARGARRKGDSDEAQRNWDIRRLRTVRQLDKIEKEMGYCETKLEKERRLQKQVAHLQSDLKDLDRQIEVHRRHAARGPAFRNRASDAAPSRQGFLAAGILEILEEEREILGRELTETLSRLESYTGFEVKRSGLEEEKRSALKDLAPSHSARMRRMNEDMKRVERQWNALTEDAINLNEAIFFLERNLDYLRSGRNFLISAKGGFDIEAWRADGYLSDLLRHSTIGRAKEMADGADRNLKMAQKELVCLVTLKVKTDPFRRVLQPFLDALYEDVYVEGKLQNTLQVVEAALAGNLKLVEQIKARRDVLAAKLDDVEKVRNQVYSKLGTAHME